AKKLEMERQGISTNNKGRPKKTAVEEDLDSNIVQLFATYDHKSSPKKSISRSKLDTTVYDTTRSVLNELMTGQAYESRTELAESIRLLIDESVTTFPKDTVVANTSAEVIIAADPQDVLVSTSQASVAASREWKAPPILPPNKTTVKGLRGLLIHSDYFSQIIAKSEIPLEEFKEALEGNENYAKLLLQFKSLFGWPALLSMIEPPERNDKSGEQPAPPIPTGKPVRRRSRKSWLKTESSRMIEIRTNQAKLIESEMQRIADLNAKATEAEMADPVPEEPLNETSAKSPWYVTKKERKYYKMKSLDKSSFVFTRVKPKRDSIKK
ncbi:unnamed protein product, partial [Oppiella nova]